MDEVLISRCRAGGANAFGLLFEQYKNLVYKTAYLMTGKAADAEDILQEVFLQVHRSLGTYDPARGALSTWLHRITVNRCLNWRRGRRFSWSLERIPDRERGDDRPSLESLAERDSVRHALDGLSDKLRIVVVLRHYWGLSNAEIAQILELPLGTVKSRLNQAMQHMKEYLEPELLGESSLVARGQR